MDARTLERTAERLGRLHHEEWDRLALGVASLGLSVLAAAFRPALALPLLIGGVVLSVLGVRACWQRWTLVEDLASEPDAYSIREVRARAEQVAGASSRQILAGTIRSLLDEPRLALADRVETFAPQLEELAADLESGDVEIDLAAAVDCLRLLSDPGTSPLFNASVPESDARACLFRIRSGLTQTVCGKPVVTFGTRADGARRPH